MGEAPTVFVVDDDEPTRDSVCALVRSKGMRSKAFSSAEELLNFYTADQPGCIITDLRLTGKSGVELQEELLARGCRIPVIVLTAYARTPVTVRAMRKGAVNMLDKPCHDDELWRAVDEALTIDARLRTQHQRHNELRARLNSLTPSERQVLQLIVEGVPNKIIAQQMDVSERTVENRRHEIFVKMQANSLAELIRMVLETIPSEDTGSCSN
jgi:FixJ family two-component response regulator